MQYYKLKNELLSTISIYFQNFNCIHVQLFICLPLLFLLVLKKFISITTITRISLKKNKRIIESHYIQSNGHRILDHFINLLMCVYTHTHTNKLFNYIYMDLDKIWYEFGFGFGT